MGKDQILNIINLLADVREKPRKWLHSGDSSIVDFVGGFNAAMAFTSLSTYRDYLKANAKVLKERGWETSSRHVWYEMKEHGLHSETILQELLTIEIESWRSVLSNVIDMP